MEQSAHSQLGHFTEDERAQSQEIHITEKDGLAREWINSYSLLNCFEHNLFGQINFLYHRFTPRWHTNH